MGPISYKQVEDLRDAFERHGATYLFIGKTGAILHGFPDTTQDADLFRTEDAGQWRRGSESPPGAGFQAHTPAERRDPLRERLCPAEERTVRR